MRGFHEHNIHNNNLAAGQGDSIEAPGLHRTPFGLRPTPAALRERRIQFWIRIAIITGIVLLAGTYTYYA